jgi:DtxR family Mn-dependent transcriptional regulator
MLGFPDVDPHGDPIPRPDGTIVRPEHPSLLNCPLATPVVVSRVMDQNAAFLRFLEESDLKPGQRIEVEARDEAADSVRVRHAGDRRVTLGARAASKLLVEVLALAWALALPAGTAVPTATIEPAPRQTTTAAVPSVAAGVRSSW